jgi:Transposase DDE domain group 1
LFVPRQARRQIARSYAADALPRFKDARGSSFSNTSSWVVQGPKQLRELHIPGGTRRVIAKVEWHPGELYPRVGFVVTNMSRPAERVAAFYNKRGTAEQWIKEGKGAIKWTRL